MSTPGSAPLSSPVAATPAVPAPAAERRPARWTAAAALGYVVLSLAGLALAPLPDLGSGTGAVRDFLVSAHPSSYVAGGCAQLLAYASLLLFVAGVTGPARAAGRSGGAVLLAVAGAGVALASITTAAAVVGAVVLTPGVAVPVAQVLVTAGSLATWLSVVGIVLALGSVAALGRDGTGLPAWLGWGAGVLAVLLSAAVPLAETPVAHVPALLLDVWLLAAAVVVLLRARARR